MRRQDPVQVNHPARWTTLHLDQPRPQGRCAIAHQVVEAHRHVQAVVVPDEEERLCQPPESHETARPSTARQLEWDASAS